MTVAKLCNNAGTPSTWEIRRRTLAGEISVDKTSGIGAGSRSIGSLPTVRKGGRGDRGTGAPEVRPVLRFGLDFKMGAPVVPAARFDPWGGTSSDRHRLKGRGSADEPVAPLQ